MKRYIKNIKSLALAGVACLGLASCGDFLVIEPKTFVSEDNFWNEKTDVQQMVTGLYVKMQNDAFIRRCVVWGETRCDNIVQGLNASTYTNLDRTLKEDLLSSNEFCGWTTFYDVINNCNIIITRSDEVAENDPTFTPSDVLATKAECTFLRSLCYFYLVRAFKDIPYYTVAIQSDDDIPALPAISGDIVVRNLIADLEACVGNALKAYPKDTNSRYNSNCNRATQNAIYALLADLCLWDGQYQKCVDYCQKVIDAKYNQYMEEYTNVVNMSGGSPVLFKNTEDTYNFNGIAKGFPLYPCFSGNTYGNTFDHIFGGNQNSFESIFELAFTYDGSDGNYLANDAMAALYGNYFSSKGNNGEGFMAVDEKIVTDIVNNTNGSIFENRYDVRYYENLYNSKFSTNEYTEAYIAKYVNTGVTIEASTGLTLPFKPSFSISTISNRNFIFYRLTDVMLMQAEALIELGSENVTYDEEGNPTSTGIDDNLKRALYIIWTVNRRSNMVPNTSNNTYALDINKYSTKASLEELVLKERRRELMFEGKRWFDLLRLCHRDKNTEAIKNRVSAKGSSTSSNSLFTNYESLFWPYHKEEVRKNKDLNQKPYYGSDDEDGNYASTN